MRRVGGAGIAAACLVLLAGCSSSSSANHAASPPPDVSPTTSSHASTSTPGTRPTTPTTPRSTSTRPTTSASTPPPTSPLIGGGSKIIGHERVIAYYGVPDNPTLGVLGSGSPDHIADEVTDRSRSYRGYGRPVQPALELIATVAQGSAGPDHDYSAEIPTSKIRQYLDVVHRHHMLLILDLQPGRASFISQARMVEPFLTDPSVELALDPEWKVTSGAPGGGRIGSSSAAGVNAVGHYLSDLVRSHHLPDKLLIIHQFTLSMLPDRSNITQHAGVEMALHADGFGTQGSKINIFHQLHFPHPPFGIGFKLFLTHDTHLMSPHQVMDLNPRPDIVTYQ